MLPPRDGRRWHWCSAPLWRRREDDDSDSGSLGLEAVNEDDC